MKPNTKHAVFRWIHIVFGLPILGYIYGPAEEVAPYAPMFRFVFVPVLILSGLWMWKGEALRRMISKKAA